MKKKLGDIKNWIKGVGVKLSKCLWCNKLHPTSFKLGITNVKTVYICALFLLVITLVSIPYIYEQYSIYDFQKRYKEASVGSVIKTGNMNLPRSNHSCIKLHDGNILVVGGNKGAEIFNIKTGKYTLINKKLPEYNGALLNSVLLPNGNVLIAGYYIFDSKDYKIRKIKNADYFISNNNLSINSIDSIYPILISDNKVLVFGDNIPFRNKDNKVILYDIEKNVYQDYVINFPYELKKLIGRGNTYIKKDNYIYFILAGATKIIKWNFITNKIESIRENSHSWQQVFVLNNENLLLSNGYVNNNTAILNLKTGSYSQISSINEHIYGVFPLSATDFIIFASGKKNNADAKNIDMYKLNLVNLKTKRISLNCRDYYYYNFRYVYKPQMFEKVNNNNFLYSGGQYQIPITTRINSSVIIKVEKNYD